jgi:branched-chain amino acid transport system substrate-binding protein
MHALALGVPVRHVTRRSDGRLRPSTPWGALGSLATVGRSLGEGRAWILVAGVVAIAGGCPKPPASMSTLPVLATNDPAAEADMRSAQSAEAEGRLEEAQERYEAFLRDRPQDPLTAIAELALGRLHLARGEVDAARTRLAAVADHADPSVAERARFYLGVALHLGGEHAEALHILEPFVGKTVDPEDTALLLRTLAAAALHMGDRVRAVVAYDQLATAAAPETDRADARTRLETLVHEGATAEDLGRLYDELPQDGPAWILVAVRAAKEAYAAGDLPRTRQVLAALRARNVTLDEELQELSIRVDRTDKADPRVVGAILPLSGRAREVGQLALRGLMLASGSPPHGPVSADAPQVVFRDDGGDPGRAAKAVEDLVTLHQAIAIIGPIDADAAAAAARRAQELGVPIVTLTPATGITEVGPLVFRLFFTPEDEVRELVAAARRRGAQRFAVLHPSDAFGHGFRTALERELRASGGQLVTAVGYDRGSTSFAEPLRALTRGTFDALLVPDAAPTLQLIAPALAAAGLWSRPAGDPAPERGRAITLLVPSVGYSADLVRESGRYLQGALFSRPFHPGTSAGLAFTDQYRERFAATPDVFAAYAYDAFRLVRSATEQGAHSREDLARALVASRPPATAGASGGFGKGRSAARGTRVLELRRDTLVPPR